MSHKLIVKVQLPISTNEEVPQMLVYNKNRTIEMFMPVTERFAKELKEFPYKGYYEAQVRAKDIVIGKRVTERHW